MLLQYVFIFSMIQSRWIVLNILFFYLHLRTFFHCFWWGGGKEREKNISWLPLIGSSTGDQTHNPGMCPNRVSNPQPFGIGDDAPTEPHWPGLLNVLLMQIWVFEFSGIHVHISKLAMFLSLLNVKKKNAFVCLFVIFLHGNCLLILCLVIWIVCRKHWLVFTEAVKKSSSYASW